MKMYVEMTDEEYERYKDFLSGNYIHKNDVENISVADFLTTKKGFMLIDSYTSTDPSGYPSRYKRFKKSETEVIIKITGDFLNKEGYNGRM